MKRFSNPSNGKAAHKSSSTWKFWLKALIRVLAGSDADLAVSVPHDRPYRQLWLAAAAVGRDTCSGNLVRERKNSIDIDEESYLAAPHRDEPPTHHIKLFHPRPRSLVGDLYSVRIADKIDKNRQNLDPIADTL
ncbi:hypothetical protein RJZ56_002637 [Blastomyces dermatitidis]|uniref:Uncharacterized protein n=1 Tax=Ajellomyces dermatitidis (strain ER-3 / ATCC MYA-2586) TaxID=559297 RepID=A0ABP2EVH4_AJEDR|nr:uncharacterized protein BDCG_03096 [Blastomyces dermatitidis ER-3]EEQ87976.2 hypothetical protein BDCG_03096 [Blastomyces dermatitidis ER-3]